MKPRSAPENGALVPPSRSRIAGTDPAPMKTRRAVPTASANARWAVEKDSISDLLPARRRRPREPSPRFPRASSLGNDIRHCRTPFGERTTSHMACQALRRSRPGSSATTRFPSTSEKDAAVARGATDEDLEWLQADSDSPSSKQSPAPTADSRLSDGVVLCAALIAWLLALPQ